MRCAEFGIHPIKILQILKVYAHDRRDHSMMVGAPPRTVIAYGLAPEDAAMTG